MQDHSAFLNEHSQHDKLRLRLVSPDFGHLPPDVTSRYGLTHRKPYYFFIFILDGSTQHGIDLQAYDVSNNELLFILPHQIHQLPLTHQGSRYFKFAFDEESLALLPRSYPFLVNPYNRQKIAFSDAAAQRLNAVFSNLRELLRERDTDIELILAHLNSLLTEVNAAYFLADKRPADDKLSRYMHFKALVEENLVEHPGISYLAAELGINANGLYNLVKQYSGISPKEYLTRRLILEAKRRLYYAESTSVKELAYDLGFSDPEYFSRLFKKETGMTIRAFLQDLSGN
ncbi:MAG: AraC family transcriptional regulator [Flavobacteriales bacterium]